MAAGVVGSLLEPGVHQGTVDQDGAARRGTLSVNQDAGAVGSASLLGQDCRPRRADRGAAVAGQTDPNAVQDAGFRLVDDGRRQVFVPQAGREAGEAAGERVSHDPAS